MVRLDRIHSKLVGLAVTMFFAVLIASAVGSYIIYKISISETAQWLTEIAKNNARMIEAVVHFDETHSKKMHSGTGDLDTTLDQIIAAHAKFRFGGSGEFVLAKKEANMIVYLMRKDLVGVDKNSSLPFGSTGIAEPMRNALSGKSGWMIGHDYRGVSVMAAYEPVNALNLGVVAKIDIQEIRAPFIKAGLVIVAVAMLISLFALRIFYQTSRQISEKFEDSSQQFIRLATNAKDVIYRMSLPDGKYEYVNPASSELFGITPEEFYQSPKKIQELMHPQWHSYFEEQWLKLLAGEMPSTYEYRIVTPSGEAKWISQRNTLVTDKNGSPVAIEGIATDITEHMEHTSELLREKEIAQSYLDIVGAMMVALNQRGEVTLINRKACQVLGCTEQEALGKNWFENFLPAEVRDEVIEVFEKIMTGNIELVEFHDNTVLTKNGEKRIIEWQNAIIKDKQGQAITGLLSSGQDVTERKQAEQALAESEERFSLAMRGANEGLWDWDLQTNRVSYSARWKSMLGYAEHELENNLATWERLVHPDDIEHAKQVINDYLSEKIPHYELEFRMHHKDGHWVDILSRGFVVCHESTGEVARFIGTHVDISKRKQAERALHQSEKHFKELFTENKCVELIIDPENGDIIDANRAAEKFYGYNKKQLLNLKITDINTLSTEQIHLEMERANQQKRDHFIFKHRLADGAVRDVEVYSGPIHWNQKTNLYSIVHDISDRKRAEARIRTLSQAIEQSPVSVVITDPRGSIEYVNSTFEKVSGYSMEEMKGQNPRILKSGKTPNSIYSELWDSLASGQSWQGEFQNKKKNGDIFWEYAHISPVLSKSGKVEHFVGVKEDITQKKIQEEKIIHQAHFDSLTDLPNRFLALDRLTQLINEAKRNHEQVAVLFIDLDDFKKINDSIGHDTGDEILIEASTRLLSDIRGGDTAGRLGGDEFLMLLGGIKNPSDAQLVATNLLKSFREPFRINNRDLILTASIGIAMYPEDGADASELLRNADSAMYHSKQLGRNTYSFFTEAMNREISRRLELEEQMHGALERDEFSIVYQPQVVVSSGKIIGAEALLRWVNPVLGNVSPVEFIPVSEHSGMIIKLGQYVMEEALQQTKYWQQYLTGFRIAVNLSPRQFRDPDLVKNIHQLLQQAEIDACHLELEITEGVLMSGHDYIDKALGMISDLGINISMDDFGTGYSSLSYLRSYPFNVLKIDQSFIKDISVDPADRELISAAIAMAHGLGLEVVAEGVETQEQLDYLAKLNCDYAQGYFFSKLVNAEEFTRLLRT